MLKRLLTICRVCKAVAAIVVAMAVVSATFRDGFAATGYGEVRVGVVVISERNTEERDVGLIRQVTQDLFPVMLERQLETAARVFPWVERLPAFGSLEELHFSQAELLRKFDLNFIVALALDVKPDLVRLKSYLFDSDVSRRALKNVVSDPLRTEVLGLIQRNPSFETVERSLERATVRLAKRIAFWNPDRGGDSFPDTRHGVVLVWCIEPGEFKDVDGVSLARRLTIELPYRLSQFKDDRFFRFAFVGLDPKSYYFECVERQKPYLQPLEPPSSSRRREADYILSGYLLRVPGMKEGDYRIVFELGSARTGYTLPLAATPVVYSRDSDFVSDVAKHVFFEIAQRTSR